jgi:hypothetical protein
MDLKLTPMPVRGKRFKAGQRPAYENIEAS